MAQIGKELIVKLDEEDNQHRRVKKNDKYMRNCCTV